MQSIEFHISHLKLFVDSLFSLFSCSTKNQHELQAVAADMGTELLHICCIFYVRWVFSTDKTLKALWHNYLVLHKHFTDASISTSHMVKEQSIVA